MLPIVAIVGRPNVGKSALFNKLTGSQKSIVDNKSGVTRDRTYGICEWTNRQFWLIDTGGIDLGSKDSLIQKVKDQTMTAIEQASLIILVVDVKTGITPPDMEVAELLKKSEKKVMVAVNKCDGTGKTSADFYEFYNLGFENVYPISAIHGHNLGDMLDAIINEVGACVQNEDTQAISVAIIGRPNAGKSSLLNRILSEERMIVSDEAGTTRDAVDSVVNRNSKTYLFIDTAGIRRKSKVTEDVERYSNLRAQTAIDRSDICILIIDAKEGFAEQDSKIVGYAHNQGKGIIIAVNKWDLTEKESTTMKEFDVKLKCDLSFISYAPTVYISAKTGKRVENIFPMIDRIYSERTKRITTGKLNELLAYTTARVQPPSDRGKRLKLYYMTQISIKPPTFIIFVNKTELFHYSYKRYIENQIRDSFGFYGTPIVIFIRKRKKDLKGLNL